LLINYDRIVRSKYINQYEGKESMEPQTVLEKLDQKIDLLLQKCANLQQENDVMRSEIAALKVDKELKETEIEKLTEENTLKDMEIEEIVNKIESILG